MTASTSPSRTSDVVPVLVAVALTLAALGAGTGAGIVTGDWSWLAAAAVTGGAVCVASILVAACLVARR